MKRKEQEAKPTKVERFLFGTFSKRKFLKGFAVSTFAIVILFNINSNGKSKSINVKLSQEAKAALLCAENCGGRLVCCRTTPGSCNTSWGDFEGPYYKE